MKAFKSSFYSATAIGIYWVLFCRAYLDFPRESALWPSDGDLLLITELRFTDKMRMKIAASV